MASRRSRIKGIANIPQRRKATNEENKLNLTESEAGENEKPSENKDAPLDNSNTGNSISNDAIEINLPKPEALTQIVKETFNNGVTNIKNEAQQNSKDCDKNLTPATEPPKPATEPPKPATEPPKPTNILKRKFIKAPVSLNAIKNRKKPYQESLEKGVDTQVNETVETNKNKVLGNFEQSSNNDLACTVNKEFIKNEEVSAAHDIQNQLPKEDNIGNLFQKPVPLFSNIQHSDTEYPLPPPSPNKANRSRIKAIPRLAQRKHSFSASESEDESRKINRIRNDSVCSTTSMVAEPITECFSPQRTRDPVFTTQVKKVVARSEQTRKLAEDRIDFYRRFGAKKPERHRLKMADLIFYNPESNPMTNEENIKNNEEPMEEMVDDPNGEAVDDPIKKDITKSDEENEMPVPQIKIGPSGEIILDEQSLVVERKEVQRQREEMEKTKILDADRMKTGYGIYKKHKRTKAWSHEETIMFYTVLNTVGTDFMAVTEFFPNRSRRDVKAKFKKEEKINRHLIDKALGEPYRFDIDDLKHDIDAKIREQEELRRQKAMEAKLKEDRQKELLEIKKREIERRKLMIPKPSNNKNHADDAINVKEEIKPIAKETKEIEKTAIRKKEIPQGTEGPKVTLKKEIHHKPKPKKPRKEKQLSMKMFMSDSDADESDLATQSESDDDVILSHKPTRSGRVPKLTQRYEDEVSLNSLIKEKENSRIPKRAELKNVEPGSVMIITEDGPNGEPIYKIFMVTPEQQATPLNIPSDDVAKVIQLRKGFTAHNIMTISANATTDEEDENSVENNFTIPEDENVTTLKSCDENSVDMVSEQNVTIPADASVTTLRSRVDNDTVENVIPEQNVTIAEDASVTNLRSRVDSDTVENDLTYDISSPQGPLHDDDLQANVGNGDINAYSENIKIIATEPIILDNPTASTVSDSVCFIGDEKSENLNESNIQISVANTEERTEKFKVLATESSVLDDSGIQENFIVLDTQQSDLPINTEIVFRVNNDGMCSKELNEDDEQPLHQAPLNNVEMSVDS
ncbi:uncharacterized protein LOC114325342 isoform X2 [Diabrotica virgifera virgifera]|uniref:Myb-like domain-containing protein n=1 Tax=Diabrotica virgifera virgifera TaxID=50390 RepID=A0ABM5JKX3_DIAVI|nr:uncharacterized protein LOC114325342 isoform X2 [Diabrotica virgifera virgifera]